MSYLDHLPAIFREPAAGGRPDFFPRFLLAFEKVLTGLGDLEDPGIEEILDGIRDASGERLAGIHHYFDPLRTGEEFLDWLAGWVALSLRADLDDLRKRDFIARAVSLYRQRGTKQGLEELVRIYTRLGATIEEQEADFQIGVNSTIGEDTLIGGGAPHFFRVLIRLPAPDPEQIRLQRQVVTAILDAEKPAHTHYELDVETPILQIGVHSTIGEDTLLGPAPE